jgi:hypothetical protein
VAFTKTFADSDENHFYNICTQLHTNFHPLSLGQL